MYKLCVSCSGSFDFIALLLDGFVACRLFVVYWLSSDLLSGLDVWPYLGFLWRLAFGACLED